MFMKFVSLVPALFSRTKTAKTLLTDRRRS
jgi:hypothetical protein